MMKGQMDLMLTSVMNEMRIQIGAYSQCLAMVGTALEANRGTEGTKVVLREIWPENAMVICGCRPDGFRREGVWGLTHRMGGAMWCMPR